MKILSALFMIAALLGLLIGVIWRLMDKNFPIANIPPNSMIEFAAVCLLFAIALSVNQIANKS